MCCNRKIFHEKTKTINNLNRTSQSKMNRNMNIRKLNTLNLCLKSSKKTMKFTSKMYFRKDKYIQYLKTRKIFRIEN